MRAARQHGIGEQLDLFDEALKAVLGLDPGIRPGDPGLGRSEARPCEEPQTDTAWQRERALTRGLMEQIASSANLNQAYKRVTANRAFARDGERMRRCCEPATTSPTGMMSWSTWIAKNFSTGSTTMC